MSEPSIEQRLLELERTMTRADAFLDNFEQIMERQFRGQAELLHQRFFLVDARLNNVEARLTRVETDLKAVRAGINVVLERLR